MHPIENKSTPGKQGFRLGFRFGLLVSAILSPVGIGMITYAGVRDGAQYLIPLVIAQLILFMVAGTLLSLLTGCAGAILDDAAFLSHHSQGIGESEFQTLLKRPYPGIRKLWASVVSQK
jgi:hypothetical protein